MVVGTLHSKVIAGALLVFVGGVVSDALVAGPFLYFEEISGVAKWSLYPYLWEETLLNITCPGLKDFSVYVSKTKEGLLSNFENHERAWCGWNWFIAQNRAHCLTHISPFGTTYVAVGRSKSKGTRATECQLETYRTFSYWLVAQGVIGTALFLSAGFLSTSTPFRLTAGTLMFMGMSFVMLAFVLQRALPDRRKLGAAFMVMGGSALGFFKWLFGSWLPSWHQLVNSKITWGYLVASALTGMALTYLFDNPANAKVNTILKVALQLLGLGLLGTSTSLSEFSLAACAALLVSQLISQLMPRVRVQQQSMGTMAGARKVDIGQGAKDAGTPRGTPLTGGVVTPVFAPLVSQDTPSNSYQGESSADDIGDHAMSPLVKKGFILNEESGRVIQMEKSTYKKLVSAGYVVDTVRGVITPPPAQRRTRNSTRMRSALAPPALDSP